MEVNLSCSTTQEIPWPLWKPNVQCHVENSYLMRKHIKLQVKYHDEM
jgi:hypothetical protein